MLVLATVSLKFVVLANTILVLASESWYSSYKIEQLSAVSVMRLYQEYMVQTTEIFHIL